MSAELVDPFAPAKAMDLDEYDAIRDAVTAARFDDKALLPEALDTALQALGVIAVSRRSEDAQFAAQTLRRICQRAVTGVPMYEPQEEVL